MIESIFDYIRHVVVCKNIIFRTVKRLFSLMDHSCVTFRVDISKELFDWELGGHRDHKWLQNVKETLSSGW